MEYIRVVTKDYEKCEQASTGKNFWGNSKKGVYGSGLGREEGDPYKPARIGLLGQMAFSLFFDVPVDLKYRKHGDSYDNLINGIKIDVKCAMRNYGIGLIYQSNEWGKIIPVDKDVYVFGYVEEEDRCLKEACIVLVGYALQGEVIQSPVARGRKGSRHFNYEIEYSTLHPIEELSKYVYNRE